MSRNPLVEISVIIITHQSREFIFKCLKSILTSTLQPKEILMFDNHSSDLSKKDISILMKNARSQNTKLKFIGSSTNLGFAKAVNLVAKKVTGNVLAFVNPDFFVNKKSFQMMHHFIQKEWTNLGAVGGRIYSVKNGKAEKTVAHTPNVFTLLIEFTSLKKILGAFGFQNASRFWDTKAICSPKNIEVDSVSGCFMFVKKETFKKIGGFDEKFFMYLEDLDLCTRLKVLGLHNFYTPRATGKHYGGGSSKKSHYKINEKAWSASKRYYSVKRYGTLGKIFCYLFDIDDLVVRIKKKIFATWSIKK